MSNYNDGKWHGWNGGECPVHPETVVEVQADERSTGPAGAYVWSKRTIAFRVIKEHREPREWWIWAENKRPMFVMDRPDKRFPKAIHVREVLE